MANDGQYIYIYIFELAQHYVYTKRVLGGLPPNKLILHVQFYTNVGVDVSFFKEF